jgi:MFS family permease
MCSSDWKTRLQCRYLLSILGFIGFIFNYLLRVNINLIITSMTVTNHHHSSTNKTNQEDLFHWNTAVKNDVISSFYYGYILLQLPGGRMAELFGGKKVLGLAIGLTAMLTLIIPTAAKQGGYGEDDYPYYLVILRALMGLSESVTFPAITSMLAHWAPIQEKAFLTTLIMSGSQVGTIVAFFVSGVTVDALGWEATFYIQGSLAFIWVLVWMLMVHDTPASHPYISEAERKYIQSGVHMGNKNQAVPWGQIFRSVPVLAIFVANFCTNFGFHLLMTELPQYLQEIFHDYFVDSTTIGIWTGIPYACAWVASVVFSKLCDFLIRTNRLSVTNARKLFSSIGFGGNIICLIILAAVPSNSNPQLALSLVTFTVCTTLGSAWFPGWLTNFQDIAPQFAGTIFGMSNSVSCITAFIDPRLLVRY